MVEGEVRDDLRRDEAKGGGGEDQPGRQAQEREGQYASHCDAVQDAEEDVAFRENQPGDEADGERRAADPRQPLQKGEAPEAARMSEDEADASQGKEGACDGAREPVPCGIADDRRRDEPQIAQVPGEMVDRHGHDRDAAGEVDGIPALGGDGLRGRRGHGADVRRGRPEDQSQCGRAQSVGGPPAPSCATPQ